MGGVAVLGDCRPMAWWCCGWRCCSSGLWVACGGVRRRAVASGSIWKLSCRHLNRLWGPICGFLASFCGVRQLVGFMAARSLISHRLVVVCSPGGCLIGCGGGGGVCWGGGGVGRCLVRFRFWFLGWTCPFGCYGFALLGILGLAHWLFFFSIRSLVEFSSPPPNLLYHLSSFFL